MRRRRLPSALLAGTLAVALAGGLIPAAAPALAKTAAPAKGTANGNGHGGAAAGKTAAGEAGGGFDFADQKSGTPLEVYADQGLELSQDAKTVIARGNAKAVHGRVTVTSDLLMAHYRDKQPVPGQAPAKPPKPAPKPEATAAGAAPGAGGTADAAGSSSEIWRVEATGHVVIATETEHAYGDHADYNIDDAVVVLTGKNLRLTTPTDLVTARDSLEYWENRQQAVARGNAVAVRGEKRIQADVLVADFAKNDDGQLAMSKAHAYDHVVLTTEREVVSGDRGDYDAESGIVTISGSVKMTREGNQLDGGYAVVNLNTGISRLFPTAPGVAEQGKADRQVKGLFVPQKKQPAGPQSAPQSGPQPAAPDATATPPAAGGTR